MTGHKNTGRKKVKGKRQNQNHKGEVCGTRRMGGIGRTTG